MVSGNNILEIPTLQLDNLVNKVIKILSGEKPSLIDIGLTKNLQPGKLLQGEIIKVLPKKKVAISFGGQKMIAEISEVSQKKEGNSSVAKARYLFKPGSKIYAKVEIAWNGETLFGYRGDICGNSFEGRVIYHAPT